MFRYIAFIWNPCDLKESLTAQSLARRLRSARERWCEICVRDGLQVFYIGAHARSLDVRVLQPGGVILGALFERCRDVLDDSPARRWTATDSQAEAIVASRGRWLVDNCWGNYAALLPDPTERSTTWVLKDPTGELPCLVADFQSVTVIFSRLADALGLTPFTFRVDRSYLRARVLYGGADPGRSALEGITQVGRGECVKIDRASGLQLGARQFYWHPSAFAEAADALEDAGFAARALRSTLRACTRTLASCHESVLHRLSGGLDSSIVAACLKDSPNVRRLCAYTYYNPRGRSDERPWARLVVRHLGLEHVEWPVAASDIPLGQILTVPPLPEPTPLMGYLLRSTLEQTLADEHQASAVFCGDGGDSGFCGESFAYAAFEYLQRHGLRREAVRLASQVALLTGQSTWSVLYRALTGSQHRWGMQRFRRTLSMASRLLSSELREEAAAPVRCAHPWFSGLERTPWATIRRLGMLLSAPQLYSVAADLTAPEVIAPLYAQPVIETLLRIPIYRHFEDGRERGLARRAFAEDLPPEITRRSWKDRAPGFYDELIDRNRRFLREVLLDGVLVREGLLDAAAVEDALSDRLTKNPVLPGEVFRHLDVEIWARAWRLEAGASRSESLAEPHEAEATL